MGQATEEFRGNRLISGLTKTSGRLAEALNLGEKMTIGYFCYAKTAIAINCHEWTAEIFFLNSPVSNFRAGSQA
jgi:hypothetical protein